MLTLKNYDSSNGDALKIIVPNIDDVVVTSVGGVDQTERLKTANVLVGASGSDSFLVGTFGEAFVLPALVAVETPLYDSDDMAQF